MLKLSITTKLLRELEKKSICLLRNQVSNLTTSKEAINRDYKPFLPFKILNYSRVLCTLNSKLGKQN